MTQKSGTKPNSAAAGKVVVFGLDSNWRPHAAWFPHTQADQARAAAKQLRLNVIEVANGTAADLVTKLPAGQIHAAGPAMVPPVREDLYEKISTSRLLARATRRSRDRIGDECDRLDGRVHGQIVETTRAKRIYTGVGPNIRSIAAVLSELKVIDVRL